MVTELACPQTATVAVSTLTPKLVLLTKETAPSQALFYSHSSGFELQVLCQSGLATQVLFIQAVGNNLGKSGQIALHNIQLASSKVPVSQFSLIYI